MATLDIPRSRLMDCKATLNIHHLKLDSGDEVLEVTFPLLSAHTNHNPTSLADLQTHTPLPEIEAKVEALVSNTHLSQISLLLALRDWIKHELIPAHIQHGILTSSPSEHDRRYYPTAEDVQNMRRKIINKMRNNMFDQDALKNFLQHESEDREGFRFFLRKYTSKTDSEW